MKEPYIYNKSIFDILCIVLITSIVVIAIMLGMMNLFSVEIRNHFVAITSGLIGGLATLLGVILTLKSNKKVDEAKEAENKTPELYAPIRFDICNAIYIKVYPESGYDKISNNKFYLQNTDKTPFVVNSLEVNGNMYYPRSMSYIDKNKLFCVNYYSKSNVDKLCLHLESLDKKVYIYHIKIEKNRIVRIEKDDSLQS